MHLISVFFLNIIHERFSGTKISFASVAFQVCKEKRKKTKVFFLFSEAALVDCIFKFRDNMTPVE